ncbi:F-box only protein 44 isoform X3 [Callorhinus ursinus]|nr:F-box only protein 44 isoform X3 [Zalophus californianus]
MGRLPAPSKGGCWEVEARGQRVWVRWRVRGAQPRRREGGGGSCRRPHPQGGVQKPHAMAVGNINELPENILLELFTHVPARHLLLHCRLVCSLWRDLIDLVTLWKRKCLREGFITEDWDQPVADWKIFYFLRSLHRNLLHNPCAEEGFEFWSLDVNGGDEWKVEDLSRDQRKEFPNDQVCSQARLRVQVPAVCSAPVVSTCTPGDLPARSGNNPAEERCQVEGGLSHVLQLPARRPLHLVSARRRGHSLLGRLVRPEGHQQQHHHRASPALTPPKP